MTSMGIEAVLTTLLPGAMVAGAVVLVLLGIDPNMFDGLRICQALSHDWFMSLVVFLASALFGCLVSSLATIIEERILDPYAAAHLGLDRPTFIAHWSHYVKTASYQQLPFLNRLATTYHVQIKLFIAGYVLTLAWGVTAWSWAGWNLALIGCALFLLLGVSAVFSHVGLGDYRRDLAEDDLPTPGQSTASDQPASTALWPEEEPSPKEGRREAAGSVLRPWRWALYLQVAWVAITAPQLLAAEPMMVVSTPAEAVPAAISTNLAAADRVIPSDRVTDSVTVRASPSSDSAVVGKLLPGESALFLSAVPRWYEVELDVGSRGFVSKSWTELAPGPAAPAPATSTGPVYLIHVVDVGTGLAVLVQGPDFTVLYDGGSNDDLRLGPDNRLLSYLALATPTLSRIDYLILSHPHRDHVELLPDVIGAYDVDNIWDSGATNNTAGYERFLRAVSQEAGVVYRTAARGPGTFSIPVLQSTFDISHGPLLDSDEVVPLGASGLASMQVLHADGSTHSNLNENSLVVRMDLGPVRVLFMGDSEAGSRDTWEQGTPDDDSVEGSLLACCAAELDSDVLIVGHHGSKTSSRRDFLDAVSADVYVVSSGPKKYGSVVLPDDEVITELQQRGQVFRTDLDDAGCGASNEKVGSDADGRPGGCTNIRLQVGPGEAVVGSAWVADEVDS